MSINDSWFSDGIRTFRKPIAEPFYIATEDGVVDTFNGPAAYKAGDRIITSALGEQYPLSLDKFVNLKHDNRDGVCYPKKLLKVAKLADHDGFLQIGHVQVPYTAGADYIVRHGPKEFSVVKREVFVITYAI